MAANERVGRQTTALRLTNKRSVPLALHLEPWGEQHDLAPGVTIKLMARGPDDDCIELSMDETGLTIWGWPGSVVELSRDGVAIDSAAARIPPPETPPRAPLLQVERA